MSIHISSNKQFAKPIRQTFQSQTNKILSLSGAGVLILAIGFGLANDPGVAAAAVAPPPAIIQGVPGDSNHVTKSGRAAFTFASTDSTVTFECKLEMTDWEKCPNNYWSYANLNNGNHVFTVRTVRPALAATDPAKYGPNAAYSWNSLGEIKQDIIPGDIASQGKLFAVSSTSPSLVSGDTNGLSDVFMGFPNRGYFLISTTPSGIVANGASWGPRMDKSGMVIAYSTKATNIVPGDTNGVEDVLVRNMLNKTQERITSMTGTQIGPANATLGPAATKPAVSDDGTKVAYVTKYGPSSPKTDVYVYDMNLHKTTKYIGQGDNPSISRDGTYVAYESLTGFPPSDSTSPPLTWIKVKNTLTGVINVASVDEFGRTTNLSNGYGDVSSKPDISADGRYVAFETNAVYVNPANDTNNGSDIYVYDSQTKRDYLISKNFLGTGKNAANNGSYAPSITSSPRSDGTFSIVFESYATDLGALGAVPQEDTNGKRDIIQWTGTTTSTATSSPIRTAMRRISHVEDSESSLNGTSQHGIVSPEGAFVLFQTDASNSYLNMAVGNQKTMMRGWWPEADLTAAVIAPRPTSVRTSAWSAAHANLMAFAVLPGPDGQPIGGDGASIEDISAPQREYWVPPNDRKDVDISLSIWTQARDGARAKYEDCLTNPHNQTLTPQEKEELCRALEYEDMYIHILVLGDEGWRKQKIIQNPPDLNDATANSVAIDVRMRSTRFGTCEIGLQPYLSGAGTTIAPPLTQWP